MEQFAELGDIHGQAAVLLGIGKLERDLKHLEEAKTNLNKALRLFKDIDWPPGQAECHRTLARVLLSGNRGTGQSRRAIDQCRFAFGLYTQSGFNQGIVKMIPDVATIADRVGRGSDADRLRSVEGYWRRELRLHDPRAQRASSRQVDHPSTTRLNEGNLRKWSDLLHTMSSILLSTVPVELLTRKEEEVVRALCSVDERDSIPEDAAIARALKMSKRTVSTHLSNIYAKWQVSSRKEALEEAKHRGIC
jgi:hypothetical protein